MTDQQGEHNRVITPETICTWCGSNNLEDGPDPDMLDWETLTAIFHCQDCQGTMRATWALVDWESEEEGEKED